MHLSSYYLDLGPMTVKTFKQFRITRSIFVASFIKTEYRYTASHAKLSSPYNDTDP